MKVPFFDLRVSDENLRGELLSAVERVFDHGQVMMGPEVTNFEKLIANDLGVKNVIGVSSGSSALFLSLKVLGLGPGDEVITTPFSWIITAHAISACGAKPVFVDITDDFNLSPAAVEAAITEKTKAIVPVHYAGKMCDMPALKQLADKHGLFLVEDAAQAYGASIDGNNIGSLSTLASLSFNPMKVLGAYGEAGAILTNNDGLAEKLRLYRHAGTASSVDKGITNQCDVVSLNHKLDAMQAALLSVALKNLRLKMKKRVEIADRYTRGLKGVVVPPNVHSGGIHALYVYVVQAERRNELRLFLAEQGIEAKVHHLPLISETNLYRGDFELPNALRLSSCALSLPAAEHLSNDQVDYVIHQVRNFYS